MKVAITLGLYHLILNADKAGLIIDCLASASLYRINWDTGCYVKTEEDIEIKLVPDNKIIDKEI